MRKKQIIGVKALRESSNTSSDELVSRTQGYALDIDDCTTSRDSSPKVCTGDLWLCSVKIPHLVVYSTLFNIIELETYVGKEW
jgi:hypothetical protein